MCLVGLCFACSNFFCLIKPNYPTEIYGLTSLCGRTIETFQYRKFAVHQPHQAFNEHTKPSKGLAFFAITRWKSNSSILQCNIERAIFMGHTYLTQKSGIRSGVFEYEQRFM